MRYLILALTVGAIVLVATGCAPHEHPMMLCSPVSPSLLACVDTDTYKRLENQRRQEQRDEPLQPKPQSAPRLDGPTT